MDLKTIIFLNFIGATLVLVMLFSYKKNIGSSRAFYLHTLSMGCLAIAFGVYSLGWNEQRQLPDVWNIFIGNGCMILGALSEYISIRMYTNNRIKYSKNTHIFFAVFCILVSGYFALINDYAMIRIIVVTLIVGLLWMGSGLTLIYAKEATTLQKNIGMLFVLLVLILSYRIIEAVQYGKNYNLASGNIGHVLTFISLFIYLIISGVGIILISKEQAEAQLIQLIRRDALTGVYSRKYFYEIVQNTLNSLKPNSNGLGIVMMDLDGFKGINDIYGHSMGDEILIFFADSVSNMKRNGIKIGRYGGDEFLMIIENESINEVELLLNQMLLEINQLDYKSIPIRSSIGCCYYQYSESPPTVEMLIHKADMALYQSKKSGGGCITIELEKTAKSRFF